MKKINLIMIFLIILTLFIIPLSRAALTEYPQLGGDGSYFQSGTDIGSGFFNQLNMVDVTTEPEQLNSPQFIPLIDDLDGDGVNEIVVVDSNTFKIYHVSAGNPSLIDSQPGNVSGFPTFIIFDIDGDGYKEILATSNGINAVDILEYNGTSFHRQRSLTTAVFQGKGILNCRGVDDCALVSSSHFQTTGTASLKGVFFNSTHVGTSTTFTSDGTNSRDGYCFARQPALVVADYDDDSDDEYIFTYMHYAYAGGSDPADTRHISVFEVNATNSVNEELSITITNGQDWGSFDIDGCSDNTQDYGGKFTNPLVFDAVTGGHLEIIVGHMINDQEFIMVDYDSTGAAKDRHPDFLDADGRIVSNVIRANAFTDTANTDFCVLGFLDEEEELDLLCSKLMGSGQDDQEFQYDMDIGFNIDGFNTGLNNKYNITTNFGLFTNMIHAVEHKSTTNNGDDLSEILTTYGIFEIDYGGVDDELLLVYENPKEDGAMLSVDIEQIGREDLIFMTSTNLWLIDDGFTNSPGVIDEYYINPCVDNTWQQNTSVEIRITPTDIDGDDVSSRAIIYNQNVSGIIQDSGWSVNATSGTTFTFTFTANETTSSDVIRLMARDIGSPSQIDIIDLAFSVAVNGVVFGECATEFTGLAEQEGAGEGEICNTDSDCATNFFCTDDGVCETDELDPEALGDEITDSTNIPRKYQPIVAMITILSVIGLLVGLMMEGGVKHGQALIYVPIFGGVAAWIFTVYLEWLPGWTIVVAILISAGVIGYRVNQNRSPLGD